MDSEYIQKTREVHSTTNFPSDTGETEGQIPLPPYRPTDEIDPAMTCEEAKCTWRPISLEFEYTVNCIVQHIG